MVIKGHSSQVLLSDDLMAGRAVGKARHLKNSILYIAQGQGQITPRENIVIVTEVLLF